MVGWLKIQCSKVIIKNIYIYIFVLKANDILKTPSKICLSKQYNIIKTVYWIE